MTASQLKEISSYIDALFSRNVHHVHNRNHLIRVVENARRISMVVKPKQLEPFVLEATCLLHDITHQYYKNGLFNYLFERRLARKALTELLPQFKLNASDKRIIITAIANHPFSIPFRNLHKNGDVYTKILQDADSLDYFHPERVTAVGKKLHLPDRVVTIILRPLSRWARNHIGWFLNYPKLADLVVYDGDR